MSLAKTLRTAIFISASLTAALSASAATEFFYTSSPQSWVGGGQTVSVTPAQGFAFNPSRNFDNGVSFWINDFNSNPNFGAQRWWSLDFAAPADVPLAVGSYAGATRFPFQSASQPGLNFSGNGRGNNTLTGWFQVLEVSYGSGGEVLSFAADFVQYDEGFTAWWNAGAIRFNSSIPVTAVPEPASVVLLGLGALGILVVTRRRSSVQSQ